MREIHDALLLIALGIGYLVFYFAKREEKIFRMTGYVIGLVIIFFTTFYMIINLLEQSQIFSPRIQTYRMQGYPPAMMRQRTMMPQRTVPQQKTVPPQK